MFDVDGNRLVFQDVVSVKPASMPIHLNVLKGHLKTATDIADEDEELMILLREAVQAVEKDSGRALVMQTRKRYFDRWPTLSPSRAASGIETNDIELGFHVFGVDSITYTDYSNTVQVWDAAKYQVNNEDEPCRVRFAWGGLWPVSRIQEKAICITYKCGDVIPFIVSGDTLTVRGIEVTNGQRFRVSNSGGGLPDGLVVDTDYFVVEASGATCKLADTSGGAAITLESTGTGLHFLGELHPAAALAICLRVAMGNLDREGAAYAQCERGYWARINGMRAGGL